MRVLLLITDLLIGGTPTVVRELSWRLREQGVDLQVACLSSWGPTADQIREKGIPVTALNARGVLDARVIVRLGKLIRDQRIDVVLSFLIHANVAATMAKAFDRRFRLIQSIQTTQPYPRWHWWAQRLVQSAARRVVVPSASVREIAISRCAVRSSKIIVIPNAVEPAELEVVRRPGDGIFRLGFIGRLDPIKRIADLIEALALLPADMQLNIWGAGNETERLKSLVAKLRLDYRCHLRGPVLRPQDALPEVDVLVLPSDAEGFGLVLIEAMAAGVPVVGTNVAGIRDVITQGVDGLLVPPRSPARIASAVESIRSDEALRRVLIEQAKRTVLERFSWSSVIPAYLRVISEAAES